MTKKITFLIASAVMLLTMMATTGTMWGQNSDTYSYTFSSNAWTANGSATLNGVSWTLNMDGGTISSYSSTQGMHFGTNNSTCNSVSISTSGISGTISSVTVEASRGSSLVGTLAVTVGGTSYYNGTSTTNALTTSNVAYEYTGSANGNINILWTKTSGKGAYYIKKITVVYSTGGGTTPSITASNVDIAYNATSGSIVYEIENGEGNVTASITTGGDWLTSLGTITASEVPFTCSANSAAAARTATVTLSFTDATDKVVTVTQAGNPNVVNNISDITATGTNYVVKGTIVAKSTRGLIFGDGTGYVYYYNANYDQSAYNVGDIKKISGTMDSYNHVYQFPASSTIEVSENSNYNNAPAIQILDATAIGAYNSDIHLSDYVQIQGTLVKSGNYYNLQIDGLNTDASISYPTTTQTAGLDALLNKTVIVKGYFAGVSSGHFGVVMESVEEVITSDPSIDANNVEINHDATAGSIAYTINNPVSGGVLTASTTSDWLTLGDVEETIPFTCSTNTAAASRTATVTLTYTYNAKATVSKDVTVTQSGDPNATMTIAEVRALATGTTVTTKGIVTSITENSGKKTAYMQDNTAGIVVYGAFTTDVVVGDEIRVEGELTAYKGLVEIGTSNNAPTVTVLSQNNTVTPVVKTIAEIDINIQAMLIRVENATVTAISGSNTTIAQGTNTIVVRNLSGVVVNNVISLTANVGWYDNAQLANPTDVQVVAVPAITLAQYEYNLNADGGNAELPVTYTNMPTNPQAEVIFYEANGTTTATYDWITAEINSNNNIAGHINVNEGDARSAYFKVKGKDANNNDVYSNLVTINQAAAGPHIEFNTTTYNPVAGGESKTLSFDYSGLGDNPTFTVRFYDATGETQTSYEWISGEITQGDKVTITVDANDGEARTAYFKVYGEKNENVHAESNLVTITQAAYIVDYATLPFEYEGGELSDFAALNGTSYSLNDEGSYATSNAPYRIKFTKTGDYLQVKCNEQPGVVTIGVKVFNSSNDDPKITVQGSTDGEAFTDIQELTIDAGTTGTRTLVTTESFNTAHRYVRLVFTKTVNVGVGPITIAQVDNTPSISAEDVNIAHDATEGSIAYTINNPVAGGNLQAIPQSGGDIFNIGQPNNGTIPFTCSANTGATERTATVELTYTYNRATVTKMVTITQTAAPAVMYTVNFTLDGGTFVPNDDFTDEIVEIAAGTYSLPSATKAGFDFTGWNDGDQTYAAGAEYTVSSDVDFTAQWTESTTGIIYFNNTASGTAINAASVTGDDSMGNTWTITTAGTTSYTANSAYYQVGSGNNPATSITFTMTLPQQKIISAFEAKFGGFNGTAGDITLNVGNETVGSGSLNGSTDVIIAATTTTEIGTVLTVTVTNIDKGVKCYYISYTLSDAPVVPVIDATAGSALAYNATAGSIIYEIANYEAGTMTATTTADWINALVVTTPTAEDGEVTFNVTENTSNESRSATVTLSFTYGDPAATVTKDVTVTQNGQPSITVSPATANVAFAGGTPEFAVTYESLEITKADDFDVEFYETPTSTIAGNQPSWITNVAITGNTTDGFTLTVTVAANDGDARDAYLKVYAAGSNDYIYSNLVTINQAAFVQLTTYSLVTSVDDIVSGKHYIIASSATDGDAYAMGGQTSNNRSGVAVTIDNSQITETENVYEFVINTHETSSKDVDYYTIYDAATPGYLYAASSSKNYLRTETTLDDNGKWTIAIAAEGSAASVVAQGSNTNKTMKFNSSNDIFSCYASGQSPIYLYVKDNDVNFEYYGGEVAYPENSIPDGGSITVSAGSVLTVPTGFTNTDPNAFIIQDGGQVIYNGTGTFNATLQENITAYSNPEVSDGWYLIASPVDSLPTGAVGTGISYDLFAYYEPTAYWYSHTGPGAAFSELHRGQGYLYANSENQKLNMQGTMVATNSYFEKTLDHTSTMPDDVRGFNLMGNPFTRNLGAGDMTLGGVTVTSVLTLVNGSDYTTCNFIDPNEPGVIKPGQGFFIQAEDGLANYKLIFNPSSKDFDEIGLISIKAGNENYIDKAYIQIGGGNTLRKMTFSGTKSSVYVMNEDKDFAAARIEELDGTMPVNFEAVEDGTYTITVEAKFIEAHSMHLIDNFTGADIDLLVEPSYTFNATANDNAERFTLVFDFNNYTGCNENYTSENFIYQSGDELIVTGEGELKVFDVLGRFVMSQNVSGVERIRKPEQSGVYIFMMNGNAQKIVVK